jgi:hypothetical protein
MHRWKEYLSPASARTVKLLRQAGFEGKKFRLMKMDYCWERR